MLLPDSLAELLSLFRGCFTAPTFETFRALCAGFLAQVGEHTVTGMLLGARLERCWHHSRAHDFFSQARWSADDLGLCLLGLLVKRFLSAEAPLCLIVDDTVFSRSGRKVFGTHLHPDVPLFGGAKQIRYGNCWVCLGLLVQLPFGGRSACLPFLFRLWRADPARRGYGRKGHPKKRKVDPAYPSKPELARELVELVVGRYPEREIELLGDGAYAAKAMRHLPSGVAITTRLRANAVLYRFAPTRRSAGSLGRPPLKGERLGNVRELAAAGSGAFKRIRPSGAGCPEVLDCLTFDCLWYGVFHTQPVRVVIVCSANRAHKFQVALLSTDTSLSAQEIVERYALRWAIEVCFRDAKQLTGVGEARNRTPRAVKRTVPFGFLCQSLVIAWYAMNGNASGDIRARRLHAPWYRHKRAPSYQDMLVALRRSLLTAEFPPSAPPGPHHQEIPKSAHGLTVAAA